MVRSTRIAAVGVLALLAVGAAGCGSSDDESSSSEPASSSAAAAESVAESGTTAAAAGGTAAKVAFLTFSNDGLYLPKEVAGVTEVIAPAGGEVTLMDAKLDQQLQLSQCQDAIASKRYNVMVLQPVNNAAAAVCASQAKAAGIPVVAFEFPVGKDASTLEPQAEGVVGTVAGTIDGQADKAYQAFKAACAGNTSCKVALEVPARADPLGAAMIDAVEKNGPADGITLVAVTEGGYDIAKTAETLPDVIRANPDLNAFLAEADTNALAAIPILKDAGKDAQVRVLGLGGSTSMIDAIKAGTAYGTVAYWPFTAGTVVGQMVQDAVDGKPIANPAVDFQTVAPDQPVIVTQENVDQFKPEWGQQ